MTSTGKRRRILKRCNTSAQCVARDDNLMAEILIRLPPQLLIKCKRVSKQTRSLICSHWFARRYQQFNQKNKKNNPNGLFIYKDTHTKATMFLSLNDTAGNRKPGPRIPGNYPSYRPSILQSCKGLFLYTSDVYPFSSLDTSLFVCNATIKQSVRIADPGRKPNHHMSAVGLAFDPLRSPEYKVVVVWKCRCVPEKYFKYNAEIYSSTNRSWRPAKERFWESYSQLRLWCSNIVYHDGRIYWLEWRTHNAICFDLDEECLKPFKLPRKPGTSDRISNIQYFGSCGDRLCLIERYDDQYVVFEKKTDNLWPVKYVIQLNGIKTVGVVNNFSSLLSSVLSIVQGEAEDEALVIALADKIIYYSIENNTTRILRDKNSRGTRTFFKDFHRCMSRWFEAYQYYETIYHITGNSTSTQG